MRWRLRGWRASLFQRGRGRLEDIMKFFVSIQKDEDALSEVLCRERTTISSWRTLESAGTGRDSMATQEALSFRRVTKWTPWEAKPANQS